jgi:hypothetical protein
MEMTELATVICALVAITAPERESNAGYNLSYLLWLVWAGTTDR